MKRIQGIVQNKLIEPIKGFLIQGVTPEKLSMAIALGIIIAIFPILGLHTLVTFGVIFFLRINPPSIFLITNIAFPMYFLTLIPFLRLGETIFAAPHLPISVGDVYQMLNTDFKGTFVKLWLSLLYAVVGWLISSIPIYFSIYYIFVVIFKKINLKLNQTT